MDNFEISVDREYYDELLDLSLQNYFELGIDLREITFIPSPKDNPLTEDQIIRDLEASTYINGLNGINIIFLEDLGLNPKQPTNYEPVYLDALKVANETSYEQARDTFIENWIQDTEDRSLLYDWWQWNGDDVFAQLFNAIVGGGE